MNLIETYREITRRVSNKLEVKLDGVESTTVRAKEEPFNTTDYVAFNVTIDNVTYYADFKLR